MIAYDRLSQIIPADQALANKALQVSLQQITGITLTTLPVLGNTIANLETTKDLPLVSELTVAVPPTIADYYINSLRVGNVQNINISSVLGTMVGYNETEVFIETVSTMDQMNLTYLDSVYATMINVVNGVYDDFMGNVIIPPGTPGTGTYPSRDSALSTGLIPVAQTEIGNLVSAYPTEVSTMNTGWTQMANQVVGEQTLQSRANLVFANLSANDKTSIYNLIYSLPQYGLDISVGGTAQFLESAANLSSFTGQCVVAAMREGRNTTVLGASSITTNSNIPSDPNPPLANATLIPSTYTATQAQSLIIK